MQYQLFEDALDLVRNTANAQLAKIDFEMAFRLLPLHPESWNLVLGGKKNRVGPPCLRYSINMNTGKAWGPDVRCHLLPEQSWMHGFHVKMMAQLGIG